MPLLPGPEPSQQREVRFLPWRHDRFCPRASAKKWLTIAVPNPFFKRPVCQDFALVGKIPARQKAGRDRGQHFGVFFPRDARPIRLIYFAYCNACGFAVSVRLLLFGTHFGSFPPIRCRSGGAGFGCLRQGTFTVTPKNGLNVAKVL
jgi:hypothetical protein